MPDYRSAPAAALAFERIVRETTDGTVRWISREQIEARHRMAQAAIERSVITQRAHVSARAPAPARPRPLPPVLRAAAVWNCTGRL